MLMMLDLLVELGRGWKKLRKNNLKKMKRKVNEYILYISGENDARLCSDCLHDYVCEVQ